MIDPETRFTLKDGSVARFCIPWDADEGDLKLFEELVALQLQQIRKYRERVSKREEWWLKNRHLGP